jgi:glutamate-1-semialdehyde 2,1-aminomutase
MAEKVLTNDELIAEARRYLVGGVNSPVRSFRAVGGDPVFMHRAKGSRLYDESGRGYIDYCLSWGALILGHGHPAVIRALKEAAEDGLSFGTPTRAETEFARVIREALPSIERLRLTNSGTEAVMGAVRVARGFTGRTKIVKFEPSYHGHADYLLKGRGIPEDFSRHTLVVAYNDIKGVEAAAARCAKEIAAIIVEPVAANNGLILPQAGFLEALREVSDRYGIVLIFDEVITGFRVSYGSAQGLFNIKPDITCLGKIIGGGLAVGAFGGRQDMMKVLAPEGEVYQAGTFSGNPLTVRAGLETLKVLKKEDPYAELKRKTDKLCDGIKAMAKSRNVRLRIERIASIFNISFNATEDFGYFFHRLLDEDVYLAPSPLEANFLSAAHTDGDIEMTLSAAGKALESLRRDRQ